MSPADSLAALQVATQFIQAALPGVTPAVAQYLAQLACSVPIIPVILAWEWVGGMLNQASPLIANTVGKWFSKFSFILNPLLGAILGHFIGHQAILGMVAGGLYGMVNSGLRSLGKTDMAGLSKAKATVALILGLGLALSLASPASAAGKDAGFMNTSFGQTIQKHGTLAAGFGVEQYFDKKVQDAHGVFGAQAGWVLSNHLGLRLGMRQPVVSEGSARWEGMLWINL